MPDEQSVALYLIVEQLTLVAIVVLVTWLIIKYLARLLGANTLLKRDIKLLEGESVVASYEKPTTAYTGKSRIFPLYSNRIGRIILTNKRLVLLLDSLRSAMDTNTIMRADQFFFFNKKDMDSFSVEHPNYEIPNAMSGRTQTSSLVDSITVKGNRVIIIWTTTNGYKNQTSFKVKDLAFLSKVEKAI